MIRLRKTPKLVRTYLEIERNETSRQGKNSIFVIYRHHRTICITADLQIFDNETTRTVHEITKMTDPNERERNLQVEFFSKKC